MNNVISKIKDFIRIEYQSIEELILKLYIIFACFYGSYIFFYDFLDKGSFYTKAPVFFYFLKDIVSIFTFMFLTFIIFKRKSKKQIFSSYTTKIYISLILFAILITSCHIFQKGIMVIMQHEWRNILFYSYIFFILKNLNMDLKSLIIFLFKNLKIVVLLSVASYFFKVSVGANERLFGTFLNPNNLGLIMNLLFFYSFSLFLKERLPFELFFVFLSFLVILMTNSWQNISLMVLLGGCSFILNKNKLINLLFIFLFISIILNIVQYKDFDFSINAKNKLNNLIPKASLTLKHQKIGSFYSFGVKEKSLIQLETSDKKKFTYIYLNPGDYKYFIINRKLNEIYWDKASIDLLIIENIRKEKVFFKKNIPTKFKRLYLYSNFNNWEPIKMELKENRNGDNIFTYSTELDKGRYFYFYFPYEKIFKKDFNLDLNKGSVPLLDIVKNEDGFKIETRKTNLTHRFNQYIEYFNFIRNRKIVDFLFGDFIFEKYRTHDSQHLNLLRNSGLIYWLIISFFFIFPIYNGLKNIFNKTMIVSDLYKIILIYMILVYFISFLTTAYLNRFPLNFFFYLMLSYLYLYKPEKKSENGEKNEDTSNKSALPS